MSSLSYPCLTLMLGLEWILPMLLVAVVVAPSQAAIFLAVVVVVHVGLVELGLQLVVEQFAEASIAAVAS